nr:ribose 5-phosphate isomerase, type A [Tanacetum cinerariifolium]
MKRQSFILSSIIPGKKAPGNDIDVYLKPLIKELQLLWKGVVAYDAFSKQHFKLKASLMWTINDFPEDVVVAKFAREEKVDNQTKEIHTHKKQLEMCNKELETCKKQLAPQNKKVESYKKQVETQGLQMKNMDQKLNEVYGMLKLLPAFPDLDNVASTSAAGTCDKQPSSSPSPFMDEDHYSPVMDHPSFGY